MHSLAVAALVGLGITLVPSAQAVWEPRPTRHLSPQAATYTLPPLSATMIQAMADDGATVQDVQNSTPASESASTTSMRQSSTQAAASQEASAAASAALGSFDFLTPDNLAAASSASVTIHNNDSVHGRRLWVVYLEGVHQPTFGGVLAESNVVAQMYVLIDPRTMEWVYGASY